MADKPIHCLLNCLAAVLSERELDCRPLFFGVWDEPFSATGSGISYFDENLRMDPLLRRFVSLYSGKFVFWYDAAKSREDNFAELARRLSDSKRENQLILVDLFYLPYSPSYRKKHLPHIVIADRGDATGYRVRDPFFGWSGFAEDTVLREAFGCGSLYMGLALDAESLAPPGTEATAAAFEASLALPPNRLAEEVRSFLRRKEERPANEWFECLEQVGILSKRYCGYELALAFFREDDILPADRASESCGELLRVWENVMYGIAKLAVTGKKIDPVPIDGKLDKIVALEAEVRLSLRDRYREWRDRHRIDA